MGSQRSKEDDVQKISTSVFVTNVRGLYGAKDLWNTCKTYGHAVDAYIPNRRSKARKRFGFVRFIKVFDVERLVNNLYTVWVGRYKLHANVARFQRESLNKHSNQFNGNGTKRDNVGGRMNRDGAKGTANSYVHAVKGTQGQKEVKEFASLTNLKVVLAKEFYANIEIKYIGGLHGWRLRVFHASGALGILSVVLHPDETVMFESFKMVYHGKVCWVHAIEVPGWVPDFKDEIEEEYDSDDGSHEDEVKGGDLGNLKDLEGDSDVEEVPESKFEEESNKHTLEENSVRQSNAYLKYPPGFTPNEDVDASVEVPDILLEKTRENDDQEDEGSVRKQTHLRNEALNDAQESICSGHFKKSEVPRSGGPILQLIDELVNVRQTMGYDMTGEVITMGDFNEVRDNSDRFGLVFNKQGGEDFNSFISNAGLVEVPLDHRPILMREIHYDYRPTPFKFFHYWFEIDGFDKLVEDSWKEAHVTDQNAYVKLMKNLRYLKEKIQMWGRLNKESSKSRKRNLKAELADLDLVIDKGEGADVDVKRRQEVVSLLQEVEKVDSMGVAQKEKIKWAIEGDENSKYYHGVLNKKRGRLAIHGVLIDGIWMEPPSLVKNEFFDHFKNRFEQPLQNRIQLEKDFLNRITTDQNEDLEREVSKEEIKREVWDCGIDKAHGPDGFTFGFYRRYWNLIESNVVDAVKWFFQQGTIPKGEWWMQVYLKGLRWLPLFISHLFYTDDAIFMGQWNQSNIDTITRVLEVFHRASGLRINMNKSSCKFSVSSVRKVIDATLLPNGTTKTRWIKVVPIKINVHAWKVKQDCLPTRVNISRRGMKIESMLCHICDNAVMGVNTSFWDVAWCRDVAFKVLVPRLYALEMMKNIDVASKLSHDGLEFSFRRNPRGGVEQDQLELLKERKVIDATLLLKGTTKTKWIKLVPIKINVHVGKVKHDCLPTRVNISRRGIKIESMLCPMCDNAVESSRHLFFSCHFISELMHKITRLWDMDYMEINSFKEWLEWVSSIWLPLKQK
nr:RNA-directed DNA polymerase, eukaryota [Tanacetum cinerariifolium]